MVKKTLLCTALLLATSAAFGQANAVQSGSDLSGSGETDFLFQPIEIPVFTSPSALPAEGKSIMAPIDKFPETKKEPDNTNLNPKSTSNPIIEIEKLTGTKNTLTTKGSASRIKNDNAKGTPESKKVSGRDDKTVSKSNGVREVPKADDGKNKQGAGSHTRNWTAIEIVLCFSLLIFGGFVLSLQTYLIINMKLDWTPFSILRSFGLTLIIISGVLLIAAGYSNDQMAPIVGLLGTLAGYLLGAADSKGKKTEVAG